MKGSLFLLITVILTGCLMDKNYDIQGESDMRKWTFIVYMAADNDLESAAIANFNELEAVQYGSSPVSILVLMDRTPNYDMTNGNWSDTRLFEIKTEPAGLTAAMYSPRIDCPELGLQTNVETELNMADSMVLSRLIDFAKRAFPAERYALIMWGHGTGWRGGESFNTENTMPKAAAFDDTNGQYMSLPSFGRAVSGKGLSVIGFDTCYGAVLEMAYQIRDDAALFIGSEGEILSSGWNYSELFTDFLKKPDLSISDFGNSVQYQYSKRYAGLSRATISQIRLPQIANLFAKFENFAGSIASSMTTQAARNAVLSEVMHNVESYYFTVFPSDLFIDIYDFSTKITAIRASITSDIGQQNGILNAANELENALTNAIPSSWAQNGSTKKIGVHLIPLMGISTPASAHDLLYIRSSPSNDKSAFVENSQHWVPNMVPQNGSFLDKLFYWAY